MLSTRDDEDYAIDTYALRGVDRLGRPVRAAEADGEVAISLTEDLVADWVDDESRSLGEEDELLRVAQELDQVGVVSALIIENDFSFRASPFLDPERLDAIEEQLDGAGAIEARFDVIGIGAGEIDGDVVLIAVYLFRDEQDAEESVDVIDDLWSGAELIARPGSQADDFVDLVSVTQSNEAVVVVAQPLDVPPMRLGASLVFQQEILFVHR